MAYYLVVANELYDFLASAIVTDQVPVGQIGVLACPVCKCGRLQVDVDYSIHYGVPSRLEDRAVICSSCRWRGSLGASYRSLVVNLGLPKSKLPDYLL